MNTTSRAIVQAVLTTNSSRSKPERDTATGAIEGNFESVRSVATINDCRLVTQKANVGFPVHQGVNRFHDAMIQQLASEVQACEILRVSVRNSLLAGI